MTKLEQCLRLIYAMDEGGRIELRQSDEVFTAAVMDSDDGELLSVVFATLEETIEELHRELGTYALRMREASSFFEVNEKES